MPHFTYAHLALLCYLYGWQSKADEMHLHKH